MTIAACYVTPEGVVLGADSTASFMGKDGFHYLDFNQKVFEIGSAGTGTLGVVTWGLGGLGPLSYRTLLARLADDIEASPPATVAEAANRWTDHFWASYDPSVQFYRNLSAKQAHVVGAASSPTMRTLQEEEQLKQLPPIALEVGFFIGGYVLPSREPEAFGILFNPLAPKPSPAQIPMMNWSFSGAPNMIGRLIRGHDENLRQDVLASGKWGGTDQELDHLLSQYHLATPQLPIRDAIDFTHACIASTIKALKFSNLPQICGGPIELAVITTDRPFRWVRHKEWDAAIMDGVPA